LNPDSYVGRAARRVFADGTIWWRAVVLSALQLIPIFGGFVATGYIMVVMRDAAWGVDRGLPRASEGGEILKRGLDGFIVSLVWSIPLIVILIVGMIGWVVSSVSSVLAEGASPQLPWWLGLAIVIPAAFLSIFIYVAWLRAAVYLKASAGLSLSGVRQLIGLNRDRFQQVAWLPVAVGLFGAVLSLPATLVARNPELPVYVAVGLPYLSGFVVGVIQVPLSLVVATAYGLWGSETNPSNWPPLRAEPAVTYADVQGQSAVGRDPL